MEKALQNIMRESDPETRFVQINEKISTGVYKTSDVYGRIWRVRSSIEWQVGDYVVIQLGRIVEKTSSFSTVKTFEV